MLPFSLFSRLVCIILMVFVNHAQKFKWLAKRKLYAKADSCHLDPDAKVKYPFNTLHLSCCRKYHRTTIHKFPKNLVKKKKGKVTPKQAYMALRGPGG
jgi:hypothetical protein